MLISKVLIPNKEWIIKNQNEKIGSILKVKKGFNFLKKGSTIQFNTVEDLKSTLGIEIYNIEPLKKIEKNSNNYLIYDYPCSSKPYDPVFHLKKKLPIFAKSLKSKSRYCAGYYVIKFRKGWVKSFCPKLITLDRYKFYGPYKLENEMKNMLNIVSKNETT